MSTHTPNTPHRTSKPKSRPHPSPTFLGLALAPYPPARKRSVPHHPHNITPRPSPHGGASSPSTTSPTPHPTSSASPGVALLMVLFMLVLGTSITLDLQFDARVQLQLAANSRNALQAEYLARSSLEFTHLLLAFNSQFQRMKTQFQQYMKMAPPEVQMLMSRLQIWRIVPVDCDILKQLFGGAFGSAKKDKKDPKNNQDPGKMYNFGDFKGGCRASLEDESSKINLNRFANYQDAAMLRQQLANLFAPTKYDPLFERTHAHGEAVSRQTQIAALEDWVDSNDQVAGETGSSENSKYRYSEKGYITKNSYFDSVEEIRLVYGIDDLFFQTFGSFFTVYGPTLRININDAAPEVLSALIMTYAKLRPEQRVIFFSPEYKQFIDALVSYRSYLGFNSREEFVNWVKKPVLLDPSQFPGAGGIGGTAGATGTSNNPTNLTGFELDTQRMGSLILTDADTFRIQATGQVGTTERRITAVIHVQPRGKRDVYYWRLH